MFSVAAARPFPTPPAPAPAQPFDYFDVPFNSVIHQARAHILYAPTPPAFDRRRGRHRRQACGRQVVKRFSMCHRPAGWHAQNFYNDIIMCLLLGRLTCARWAHVDYLIMISVCREHCAVRVRIKIAHCLWMSVCVYVCGRGTKKPQNRTDDINSRRQFGVLDCVYAPHAATTTTTPASAEIEDF